ncbi:MAG: NADH-quinone oxidoreductase subunit NuoE [Syntrophorhabdales bacterium]|jgi:NADH:ubiquinone oxidoreductase subunit E
MTDVELTIDDVKVIGKEGMMILDAAELAGVNIPTLCHIRGLHPIGGCRICVVEVEGSSRLVGSCHTPIAEGMVVKTRSPKVLQTRKTLVELMLAGHTGPCVSDTRIGQCELNSIASGLEVGPPRFQARRARTYPVENVSPYLTRDMTKCILCGRCVIACAEIAKKDVFGTGYRGFSSKIVVDCDVVIDKEVCKNCGICAEYCPTSALTIPGVAVQKKAVRAEAVTGRSAAEQSRHDRLLSMLEKAQGEFGYVPEKFIAETAASLAMTISDVYGVASFYSFLSLQPRGRNIIRVCGNVPCQMKGAHTVVESLRKELGIAPGETTPDGRFSLELTNCIGACDEAPAVLVNDDIHGGLTPEKLSRVLKDYA